MSVRDGLVKGETRMKAKGGMRSLTVAGFLALLGFTSVTRAEDNVIPVDRVPKAVLSAAKAKFPGAKIQTATEETQDEKPVYRLELKQQRHSLDATFKDVGTVVLVETAVAKKELPKVVLRAAAQLYPGASLKHAGAVRTEPSVKKAVDYYVFYLLTADNRPRRLTVDARGTVLDDPFRQLRRAESRRFLSQSLGVAAR
jgi:hypothetical protein